MRIGVPDMSVQSVAHIPFKELAARGLRHVVFDRDNTLGPHGGEITQENFKAILVAIQEGYIEDLCIVSNTVFRFVSAAEIARMARELGFPGNYVCADWPNLKPKPAPFLAAIAKMEGATIESTYVVGDQLSTDICGAKDLEMFAVLVAPVRKGPWWKFLTRWGEARALAREEERLARLAANARKAIARIQAESIQKEPQ